VSRAGVDEFDPAEIHDQPQMADLAKIAEMLIQLGDSLEIQLSAERSLPRIVQDAECRTASAGQTTSTAEHSPNDSFRIELRRMRQQQAQRTATLSPPLAVGRAARGGVGSRDHAFRAGVDVGAAVAREACEGHATVGREFNRE
jgi:hypothetical protein